MSSASDIDRLPASSGLSTAVSTLIGKDDFGAVIQADFSPKCRQKMVIWSFLGYLGEIESDFQTVWTCIMHYCATVSASNFPTPFLQWFTSFDFRKLYPLFAWPSSYLDRGSFRGKRRKMYVRTETHELTVLLTILKAGGWLGHNSLLAPAL